MKTIMLRVSFLASANHRFLNKSHHLAFSTLTTQNPGFNYHNRRQEEERRSVRVSVWWDFENCNVPSCINVFRVAQCITNAVRANGIKGPIQVTAFGDVMQISRANQEALSATGISLSHVPSGGKNSADRSLLVDLMYWVSQNPPPAHIFLISGDRDFAGILHKLRMSNYNILLASTGTAPSVLCSAATIMWQWGCLLKGENLTGRLFNQPPDGRYSSWYGHYDAPLEDPYAVLEPFASVPTEESTQLTSDKVQPIPRPVIRFIRQILKSYPEGLSISQFGQEISKSNLEIDKDLYGYKKISRFLLSMPHVVKLHPSSKEQYIVKPVYSKPRDTLASTQYKEAPETRSSPKPNGEINSSDDIMKNSKASQCPEPVMKTQLNPQESQKGERQLESSSTYSPGVGAKARTKNLEDPMGEKLESSPAKRNMQEIQEQDKTINLQEKPKKALATSTVSESKDSSGKDDNKISPDGVLASETGIFRRIWMKWFVNGDRNAMKGSFKEGEAIDQVKVHSKQPEPFSKISFWNEMESFMATSQGASVFSQSSTREHLVQNLQKQGPTVLKSLSEGDLLSLIDLLISDKKWVEECNSQAFPFKLALPAGKDPVNNLPSGPNGLSHIFAGKQPHLQELGERKHQNPSSTGVQQKVVHRGSSIMSRDEMLADCHKLVVQIVKEYPEGYNMGCFRPLFMEKHGYALDLQKLGFDKLVNLLQTMPELRIESCIIFPAGTFESPKTDLPIQESKNGSVSNPGIESSISPPKDDDSDSCWDELGPVDGSGPGNEETNVGSSMKSQMGKTMEKLPEYEPLNEDEFSDSEGETSSEEEISTRPETKTKSKLDDDRSSLLQILDSWNTNGKDKPRGTTNRIDDITEIGLPPSTPTGSRTKSEALAAKRPKRSKNYSFVVEQSNDGDKLVDGILSRLKSSSDTPSSGSSMLG